MAENDDEFDVEAVDIAKIEVHDIVDALPATTTGSNPPDAAGRNTTAPLAAHEMSHQAMHRAEVAPAAALRDEELEEERLQAVDQERFEVEEAEDQEQQAFEARLESDRRAEEERQEQEAREREEREREEEEREREEQDDDPHDNDAGIHTE